MIERDHVAEGLPISLFYQDAPACAETIGCNADEPCLQRLNSDEQLVDRWRMARDSHACSPIQPTLQQNEISLALDVVLGNKFASQFLHRQCLGES